MDRRSQEEALKDALVWVGYYAYSLGLATLWVLALLIALDYIL